MISTIATASSSGTPAPSQTPFMFVIDELKKADRKSLDCLDPFVKAVCAAAPETTDEAILKFCLQVERSLATPLSGAANQIIQEIQKIKDVEEDIWAHVFILAQLARHASKHDPEVERDLREAILSYAKKAKYNFPDAAADALNLAASLPKRD